MHYIKNPDPLLLSRGSGILVNYGVVNYPAPPAVTSPVWAGITALNSVGSMI